MRLQINRVSFHYGDYSVLEAVSGELEQGESVLLVGPNGAGKSTLANIIGGRLKPTRGHVAFGDAEITSLPTSARARLGISRMFQAGHLAWNLTPLENVETSLYASRPNLIVSAAKRSDIKDSAARHLERVGLDPAIKLRSADLSFGQQRLIALARALAVPHSLLILDEPFSGLKSVAVERILEILAGERSAGCSILVIDHLLQALSNIPAKVWFMNRGSLSNFLTFHDLLKSELFEQQYLGRDHPVPACRSTTPRGNSPAASSSRSVKDPLAELEDADLGYGKISVLSRISLTVYAGETVALIGLNGAGKSTILRAFTGFANLRKGNLRIFGRPAGRLPTHKRIRQGLRCLPQHDRLVARLSISDNFRLAAPLLRDRGASSIAIALKRFEDASALPPSRLAGSLSGGEQARLALAILGISDFAVALLDEPTSSLDASGRSLLVSMLAEWRSEGCGLVVVEHDLNFVLTVGTRTLVVTPHRIASVPTPVGMVARELLATLLTISTEARNERDS